MMLGMVVAGDLSDAERRVWDAFPTGSLVEFGTGKAEDDNPGAGEGWGLDRQVRAEVLAALLCGAVEVEPGQIGEIHLGRARVTGELNLAGATIKHRLRLPGCYIADGIDLSEATARTLDLRGCHVGAIGLSGAKIDGAFFLSGAHLDGKGGAALIANGLNVTANMVCDGGFHANGGIDLVGAKIDRLVDERESWPQRLHLDGLTYSRLTYLPAQERLDWLNRSAGYSPQPYEQLAAYYRRLGHDEQARRVLLAKQRRRRRQVPRRVRWWGWLQDALAGYGYAPGRALLLLAAAFVVGCLVFSTHHPVPVGPGPHPAFNPALYTLDVLIPAPALGQASDFDPQGAGLAVAAGLHVLGWLLAITVIAAITRSFSRS